MEKKLSSISENMRRNFTANVSHELKTPITSISGYAEMMMTASLQARTFLFWRRRSTRRPSA